MASGYGLSRIAEGAVEGMNRGEARRDRATSREREETRFQQGQQDRDYRLERQSIDDARQDDQYRIAKDQQDRTNAGNEATRAWMTTGDVEPINEFANKYSPANTKYQLVKNPDGTYTARIEKEGHPAFEELATEDDIGLFMQLSMSTDLLADKKEEDKLEREAKTKKTDRQHDLAKIDREWMHRKDVENIKTGAKGKDKDSKDSLSRDRFDLSWQGKLDALATKDYGTLFGDQWKFDTTQEKTMKSAQADLSGALYRLMDQPDVNAANRKALQEMRKFKAKAENQADIDIDEGRIDKKQRDNHIADLIDTEVDRTISELAPKPGEVLQRGEGGAGGQGGEAGVGGEGSDESRKQQAIELLRKDPSNENKAAFDEIFGPDEANKALGVSGDEAQGGGAGGLIKDANAAEAPSSDTKPVLTRKAAPSQKPERKKPDYSGQKEREKIRRSQKDHQKIALSEFKNEWKNMSDKEKFDWFAENSGALKAKSERSYRKARKELRQIKSSKRFSQQNREGLKAGRENYTLKRGE